MGNGVFVGNGVLVIVDLGVCVSFGRGVGVNGTIWVDIGVTAGAQAASSQASVKNNNLFLIPASLSILSSLNFLLNLFIAFGPTVFSNSGFGVLADGNPSANTP